MRTMKCFKASMLSHARDERNFPGQKYNAIYEKFHYSSFILELSLFPLRTANYACKIASYIQGLD